MAPKSGDAVLTNKERRELPSYLSGRSFSTAVIDLFVPTADGKIVVPAITARIDNMPAGPLKDFVVNNVGEDIEKLTKGIEDWYDDHMQRVSG